MEIFEFTLIVWACTATIIALFQMRENKNLIEMVGFQTFVMKKMMEENMSDEIQDEMEEKEEEEFRGGI